MGRWRGGEGIAFLLTPHRAQISPFFSRFAAFCCPVFIPQPAVPALPSGKWSPGYVRGGLGVSQASHHMTTARLEAERPFGSGNLNLKGMGEKRFPRLKYASCPALYKESPDPWLCAEGGGDCCERFLPAPLNERSRWHLKWCREDLLPPLGDLSHRWVSGTPHADM